MTIPLWLNDVDAATYGLRVSRVLGAGDAPPRTDTTAVVRGRAGATRLADAQEGVRTITVRGALVAASAADVQTKRDSLLAVVGGTSVRLRTADATAREITATLSTCTFPEVQRQFAQRRLPVELAFTALDPYWLATSDTTVSIAAVDTPTELPLGTAPVRPVITVTGAGTAVTLTLKDSAGALVHTLELTGLAGTGDVVVDCDALTITEDGTDAIAQLAAGDFFLVDPLAYGDPLTSAWPTLEVSAGTASIVYRKAWR